MSELEVILIAPARETLSICAALLAFETVSNEERRHNMLHLPSSLPELMLCPICKICFVSVLQPY